MNTQWPPSPGGRTRWSEPSRRRIATLLCAVLPPEDVGGDPALMPAFVGSFAGSLAPARRLGVHLLLETIYWIGPLALILAPKSFGALDVATREKALRKLSSSGLYVFRLGTLALKSFAGLGVLGDPEARRKLGFDAVAAPLPPVGGRVRWDEDIEGIGRPAETQFGAP